MTTRPPHTPHLPTPGCVWPPILEQGPATAVQSDPMQTYNVLDCAVLINSYEWPSFIHCFCTFAMNEMRLWTGKITQLCIMCTAILVETVLIQSNIYATLYHKTWSDSTENKELTAKLTHRQRDNAFPTSSDAWLISNDSNCSSIHSSKADNDVLSVVCHYLEEISLVNNLHINSRSVSLEYTSQLAVLSSCGSTTMNDVQSHINDRLQLHMT